MILPAADPVPFLVISITATLLGLILTWLFIFSAVRAGAISAGRKLAEERRPPEPKLYRGD